MSTPRKPQSSAPTTKAGILVQGGNAAGVVAAAASIASLLTVAFDTHQDQKTVRAALDVLAVAAKSGSVSGVSISGANIAGPL